MHHSSLLTDAEPGVRADCLAASLRAALLASRSTCTFGVVQVPSLQMQNLLTKLEVADFEFLAGIMRSRVTMTSDKQLRAAINDFASETGSTEKRHALCTLVEQEVR